MSSACGAVPLHSTDRNIYKNTEIQLIKIMRCTNALIGSVFGGVLMAGLIAAPAQAQSYTWQNVQMVGGGYVDGIVAHPGQQGLFYAKTDVGGAYRYNAASATWVPLNDWTPSANNDWMGVDSIAVDPNNANMLFMSVGAYDSWAYVPAGAILVSSNQGASFTVHQMPFPMGSNNTGRDAGERLQVDPNNGNVLFYGTRNDNLPTPYNNGLNGLWTSTDKGTTWTQVAAGNAPPLSSDGSGAGIVFTAFYKPSLANGRSQTIFAGVSDSKAPSTLYVSIDAGAHWSAVSGGPGATAAGGMYPNHGLIGPDGNLYITYGNSPGPYGMSSGQVWKYSVGQKTWQNITPLAPTSTDTFGYDGLALDPRKSGTLMVTTVDRYGAGDAIFRSTSSGNSGSWVNLKSKATFSWTQSPWSPWGNPNVFGNWMNVVIDPFNSNNAFYGTGGGVFGTTNLLNADSGLGTAWSVAAKGIEETVPQTIASPTSGAPLIAAIADVCGFVFNSLTTPPNSMIATTSGTGVGGACTFGSGIDWARGNPSAMVLVGNNPYSGPGPVGVVSTNGGSTWTNFATLPAGVKLGQGTVAIGYDGGSIVWAPDASDNVAPVYTTNNGASWTTVSFWGNTLPVGAKLLSDGGQNVFYAWKPGTTNFYVGNGAASWYQAAALPAAPTQVSTVPGRGGEVWMAASTGLYKSTSSGSSWNAPITINYFGYAFTPTSIGFGKAATGASYPAIYTGGQFSDGTTGLMRSTDGGTTWAKINDGNHQWGGISQVVGDMRTFGTVYLNSGGGMGRGIIYGTSAN
jgi:hypothetical protein